MTISPKANEERFFSKKNMDMIKITKNGLEALQKELDELVKVKRPKLVDRLSYARSQGDLAENSDYSNAKEELEFLDGRISEIENVIKNAEVIKGAKITVKLNGKEFLYEIVGEWEADPMKKKISHTSPLGLALFGKKVGEKVEVEAPAGKVLYEILRIE